MAKEAKKERLPHFASGIGRGPSAGFALIILVMTALTWLHWRLGANLDWQNALELDDNWSWSAFDAINSPRTIAELCVTLLPIAILAASLRPTSRILRLNLAWTLLVSTFGFAYLYIVSQNIPTAFMPDFHSSVAIMFASAFSLVIIGQRAKRLRLHGAFFGVMVTALGLQIVLKVLGGHSKLLGWLLPIVHDDLSIARPWFLWGLGVACLLLCGRHSFALVDRRWRKAVRP